MTQCNGSECSTCSGTGSTRTGPSCSPEGCACEWEPCQGCGGTGYLLTVFTLGQLEDLAAYVADAEGVVTVALYVTAEKVLHADLRDEHGLSVDEVAIHAALPGEGRRV